HRAFDPTYPMGMYLSHPLGVRCMDLEDVRSFLAECRYVSDAEQFGQPDYWMLPQDFEQKKRGDCEDFALWAWRQVHALGYAARFTVGLSGGYGDGHAWVTFDQDGRTFLLEATAARSGPHIPRLETLRYHPRVSVSWDGQQLRYFEHAVKSYDLSM